MKRIVVGIVLSFLFGCHVPPYINSMYTASSTPVPRGPGAEVEVFMEGTPIPSGLVVGFVEISTERDDRPLQELLEYAKDEARKMGGDCLVGVAYDSQTLAGQGGYTFPVKNAYTGKTMGYQTVGNGPTTKRMLRAQVLVRGFDHQVVRDRHGHAQPKD